MQAKIIQTGEINGTETTTNGNIGSGAADRAEQDDPDAE